MPRPCPTRTPRPGAPSVPTVRSAQILPSSIDETVAAALALVAPSRGYLPHARGVCSRATMAYESAPLAGNRANKPLHALPLHAQPLHGQPLHGQPLHGQPLHGQPLHGQPLHGQNAKEPTQQQPPQKPPPSSTILGKSTILGIGGAGGLARYGAGGSDAARGTAEDATGARDDAQEHARGCSTQRALGRSPRFACDPTCSTQRSPRFACDPTCVLAATIASTSAAQHGAHGQLDAGHGGEGGGGVKEKPLDTALSALERTYAERLTDPPVRTADDLCDER